MKYFKNTELAKLYHVSEKSVRNWIDAATHGKLDLQLYQLNDRSYVANTAQNTFLIEQLVQRAKKYKNTRALKTVTTSKKFHETYNRKQILDIISNLTIRHEIPLKYSYVDGGADYWDMYANRLVDEQSPNLLNQTIDLLSTAFENIDRLLKGVKSVNVVDLGPGNALPMRGILEHLLQQGRLKRYVAIDISQEMLTIAENNIKKWFGGAVQFEGHVRDFSCERFDDLFADDYSTDDDTVPVNLVMLLGGTLSNFRSPNQALQTINDSLGLNDLFIYDDKLDAPSTRRYFDFNISNDNEKLTPRHRLILDFLNIPDSYYEVQHAFNEEKRTRSISIYPKMDISIEFKMASGIRKVDLRKDEPVLLWRSWDWGAVDLINRFDLTGFDVMYMLRTRDQQYILFVSKLRAS